MDARARVSDIDPSWPRRPPRKWALRGIRHARDRWEILRDPSYRRLARSYELPDGSRRIYCYHVRKTAGTSLYLSFLALGGEDPVDVWRRMTASRLPRTISGGYSFVANHRVLLAEGAYLYGRSHRPAARQPLPPKTFTVTILRDPVERVRSYFDYLVAGDVAGTPGRVAERERAAAEDGFDAFLDRIPARDLLNQLAMFSERFDVSEASDRIASCSSVLFTEQFPDGLAALGRRLQLPLALHRARVTGNRTSLTADQTERLRVRLEPEYELLRRLRGAGITRTTPVTEECGQQPVLGIVHAVQRSAKFAIGAFCCRLARGGVQLEPAAPKAPVTSADATACHRFRQPGDHSWGDRPPPAERIAADG